MSSVYHFLLVLLLRDADCCWAPAYENLQQSALPNIRTNPGKKGGFGVVRDALPPVSGCRSSLLSCYIPEPRLLSDALPFCNRIDTGVGAMTNLCYFGPSSPGLRWVLHLRTRVSHMISLVARNAKLQLLTIASVSDRLSRRCRMETKTSTRAMSSKTEAWPQMTRSIRSSRRHLTSPSCHLVSDSRSGSRVLRLTYNILSV